MRIYSDNIISKFDSLRVKDSENEFYNNFARRLEGIAISKVTPVIGIHTDLMYIENNQILFIKFMDTTEEIYSILQDELIEVMKEEYIALSEKIKEYKLDIDYNLVYIMPYVEIIQDEIEECYASFVKKHIIDKLKYENIMSSPKMLEEFYSKANDEIVLNLFRFYVCPEYHVIKNDESRMLNKDFKKILFYNNEDKCTAMFLTQKQLNNINSMDYGNSLISGPAGSGKTTLIISRAIKLARLYPKDKFLILTFNKQSMNEIRSQIKTLTKNIRNIEVHNFHGFIFKLAKQYELIVDYTMLKDDYEKHFRNIFLQAKNMLKSKRLYKGIFIDEGEHFKVEELKFSKDLLYNSKYVLNIAVDKAKDFKNNIDINSKADLSVEIDHHLHIKENYRSTKNITEFVNNFNNNALSYISQHKVDISKDYYEESEAFRKNGDEVEIIKVDNLDEKIEAIVWEIQRLVNVKGLKFSDIGIVYPYNKRKLKNNNVIYFQYIIRKILEENEIPYIFSDEELTNLTPRNGVTLSNIFSLNSTEFKALIFCEIEMLYSQGLSEKCSEYQVSTFIKNLNMIYSVLTKAVDNLIIVTTFSEDSSKIIEILTNSLHKKDTSFK